jgi:predicted RNA-binding protein YlxR (DUF448 family)
MVRIALASPGRLGSGREIPGRGAWLCAKPSCLAEAVRKRSIERALRAPLELEASELLDQLGVLVGLAESPTGQVEGPDV